MIPNMMIHLTELVLNLTHDSVHTTGEYKYHNSATKIKPKYELNLATDGSTCKEY
jgi:hypothetical protein